MVLSGMLPTLCRPNGITKHQVPALHPQDANLIVLDAEEMRQFMSDFPGIFRRKPLGLTFGGE